MVLNSSVLGIYFAGTFSLAALIKCASRDFVRAAAFGWIDRFAPARSSFFAARRNSVSAVAISPAATACRTLRTCVLTADLTALFWARRSRLWRRRFLALLVVGIRSNPLFQTFTL